MKLIPLFTRRILLASSFLTGLLATSAWAASPAKEQFNDKVLPSDLPRLREHGSQHRPGKTEEGVHYVVNAGDTLEGIVSIHNRAFKNVGRQTSSALIREANRTNRVDTLSTGQRLFIPLPRQKPVEDSKESPTPSPSVQRTGVTPGGSKAR